MSRTFFFDGKFIPEEEAVIPVTAHALHYGTGVFEGIRAYYNKEQDALFIFRLKEHYERMVQSAKILFINIPHSVEELIKITVETLQKNFSKTDIYIRPLAFKSDAAVGNFNLKTLKDSFLIYTVPLGRYLDVEKGIRANTSSWKRISDNAIPPRGKITGAYANTALAKTESLLNGFDEALLLDERGHVVEGSAENLFLVKNGKVYTPPTSDDILVGITRDTIINLCKQDLKIDVIEKSIDRSEIYGADEVFLVGTGAEVTPVIEVDNRIIRNGSIGTVSKKLKDIYYQLVHGEYSNYNEYLTKVEKSI
ncbi:MAG: Branched-chain amino acid aminotransferase [Candidatus Daviesbacteria bacterium GW2011_GWA2_38_24]|uniref:Branched-chain-amino-acid aminotransferase n=1 Tax=Candidatus Daviesbacteria bacterium GW2011_GWA2_38_24 TaxID=1618422 RepID=A0A0G0MR11_9BACT|nr:MAG: Branched-chain amino acid aminotransferase [Candidatus Daviesbacteria bacterium GW2011_GWA2_38_24]OGE23897.1 MAG: branched-chain-amino-acid transaminase [Candidatus Daviesbacteria bacterium RIFCSPHIGHO2_01_FULL_38_8]